MVADAPDALKKKVGWPAYAVSATRHLRDARMRVTLRIDDGEEIKRRARMVLVGNVGALQAGMQLLPGAEPDDGLLDVVVFAPYGMAASQALEHAGAWGGIQEKLVYGENVRQTLEMGCWTPLEGFARESVPGARWSARCAPGSDYSRFEVLEEVAPPNVSSVAEKVGRQYGERLAAEIGAPDEPGYDEAVQAVASAMTGLGFSVDPDIDGQRLLTSHCPFGDTAASHPEVICSLDRGIVTGLFGALSVPCNPVVIPHRKQEENCVIQVPVTIGQSA